jgi:hypothetical protein
MRQRLGLTLKPARGPFDVGVIEDIERPTAHERTACVNWC